MQSMEQLDLSDSAQRSDDYYREQWGSYYAERGRLVKRIASIAAGLGIFFLLFIAVGDGHPGARFVLVAPGVILLLAFSAHWFLFVYKVAGWTCPKCGELFFISAFVRNPFGQRCRHCGLIRPRESEIDHYHYGDEASRPRTAGE
jgi:hypothetical protein